MTNLIFVGKNAKFTSFQVAIKQFYKNALMEACYTNQENKTLCLNFLGNNEYSLTYEITKQTVRTVDLKDLEVLTKMLYNRNIERATRDISKTYPRNLDKNEYGDLYKSARNEAVKVLTVTYYIN